MVTRHSKSVQKTLRFGIECEFFTLDDKGYMTEGADRLIARVKSEYPGIEIKRECGKNMVEITTIPSIEVPDAMLKFLEDWEKVIGVAEKEKIILYAYGTYPGSFTASIQNVRRYRALEKIFGTQRFAINQRCIGLHLHYSLPWGVFDELEKIIKPLIRSKNKEALVNLYNLGIAMDPALATLAQSSPFYQGERLGKDARMIVYRGGKELGYPAGLYAQHPQFGSLQPYKQTNTDILQVIRERFDDWGELVKKFGYTVYTLTKHGSILDNAWNPVKINAHGTLEIRGLDMNHPDVIIALAMINKFIIKAVQEKFLRVVPADIGLAEPFKREGNKIYIPPDSYVRNELQRLAAYEGLANDALHRYCANLVKLAKEFIPERRSALLKPIDDMLLNRRTASDRIIDQAKEQGIDLAKPIAPSHAAALALILSRDLYQEINITKERLLEMQR